MRGPSTTGAPGGARFPRAPPSAPTPPRSTWAVPGGSTCRRRSPRHPRGSRTPTSTTRRGRCCRSRRTGRCTGTARPPTPTSCTRSRSTRRTCRRRTPPAIIAAPSTCRRPGRGRGPCCASTASTRARGSGSTAPSWASPGQQAADRVRRGHRAAAGSQRAGGPRAPVVVGQLPRGPGHVVALGDLPGRHAHRPPRGRHRRLLAARRLRPHHGPRRAAGGDRGATTATARLSVPELGILDRPVTGPINAGPVQPWSAETPRLYEGTLATETERVPVRIGFRTVAITNGVVTVNGRRILFEGVNRHEFHPDRAVRSPSRPRAPTSC